MSKFISRKELEVRHSRSYEMRERLKELGCEWDAIARAWIAPSLEVKELCYEILEEAEENDNSPQRPYFGRITDAWSEIDLENFDKPYGQPLGETKSIVYTPTQLDAIKISGEENVKRYWRDEISVEAAEILASGKINRQEVYDHLEDKGWKARSVSLLWDVVDHFRSYPPVVALDEKLDAPVLKSTSTVNPEEMQGSIGVISDSEGEPAFLKIKFDYDPIRVNTIKWIKGRRWNALKKQWEVPIEKAEEVFQTFPHFQCSPRATELKLKIKHA